VKTERGNRVRLEVQGVVIEATRLIWKANGFIEEVEATQGEALERRSYPEAK
jgi:hypothetical protein